MRGILGAMSPAATLAEALEPVRADPSRSAILLDIDGTLAPIVRHADDAHVPESTRTALIAVARSYAVVACVSGRQASTARRIVSLGSIAYVGAHGAELLLPGGGGVELDREVAAWQDRVQRFAAQHYDDDLRRLRVRAEDKQAIAALHWRGAPDEEAAEAAVREVAAAAEHAGLAIHWGRKVLEIRPPVEISKGRGIKRLLREHDLDTALYVGDDRTDLDAFAGLRELVEHGRLRTAVCVGVASDETPPELRDQADILVDGPPGVRGLLEALTP
ncbi:MAG: trehalose-phosphatase [Solirubrobacteraceae bacterium]|nr:trehalose-phosphatase [Solirubrobacteraceae bacterium]